MANRTQQKAVTAVFASKITTKGLALCPHITDSVTTGGSKSTYSSRPGPEPPSSGARTPHADFLKTLSSHICATSPSSTAGPRRGGHASPSSTYVEPQQRPVRIATPGPPAQVLVGCVEQHEGGREQGCLGHRWGKTRATGSERGDTGGSYRQSLLGGLCFHYQGSYRVSFLSLFIF